MKTDVNKELLTALKDEVKYLVHTHKEIPSEKTLDLLEKLGEREFVDKLFKYLKGDIYEE